LRAALQELIAAADPHEALRGLAAAVARATGSGHAWVVVGAPGEAAPRILEAPVAGDGGGPVAVDREGGWAASPGAVSGPAGAAVEVSLTGTAAPGAGAPPRAGAPPDGALARLLAAPGPVRSGEADAPALVAAVAAGAPAGTPAWLSVPLAGADGPIGLVLVAAPAGPAYTAADVDLALALAAAGALAWDNARLGERARLLASVDALTGVDNRPRFFTRAEDRVAAARSGGHPLAALMIDVDHFKDVNDAHGHRVGDDVLRTVADRLAAHLRPGDVLGRYGGEEFAAVLRDDGEGAEAVAERLRRAVAADPVRRGDRELAVTVSVGVAHLRPADRDLSALLARADAALYLAKHSGRNRVESDALR
jgi:diguanylate cyclase (GGDEF)-like protein